MFDTYLRLNNVRLVRQDWLALLGEWSIKQTGENQMKIGDEIQAGSTGRGGGRVPVAVKQSAMLSLIAGQTGLRLVSASEISRADQAKYTKGKWELHTPVKDEKGNVLSYSSPNNRVVVNAKGEPVLILSLTMLVYFLEKFSGSLTKASRDVAFEIVKGFESQKSSVLGEKGHEALSRVLSASRKEMK